MTMIQAHKRTKAYTHAFPDVVLKFEPNDLGHVVCDVPDQGAVDRLLATPTGFRLYGDAGPTPAGVLGDKLPAAELHHYILVDGESMVDLRELDDAALRAFATANGIPLSAKAKGNIARDIIVARVKE